MIYNITYKFGDYVLKTESYENDPGYSAGVVLTDIITPPNIGHTWYYEQPNGDKLEITSINFSSFTEETNEILLVADPYDNLAISSTSIHMSNAGNIVAPNGAALIFGAEVNEDNAIDITMANEETYNPYNIVIVEEDSDETLPAEQITFLPDAGSSLTGETVQIAINELEQIVYNSVPIFSQEVIELAPDMSYCNLSKTFSTSAMMVYYNGLLINEGIHYTFTGNAINFLGFSTEEGDILTVIGLASSGGNISASNVASAIGGSY